MGPLLYLHPAPRRILSGGFSNRLVSMGTQRLTFPEAAHALGISTEAVRMRVRRGTLRSERDETGTVKVLIDADEIPTGETNDALTEHLRSEVEYLREENQRKDHIIAALVSRVPALQAATDERGDANASRDDPVEGYPSTPRPREDPEKPASLWRRIFAG